MMRELNSLSTDALNIWVPAWFKGFCDDQRGGFHERLDGDGGPLDLPRRLLTQCRQIIVYSRAYMDSGKDEYRAKIIEAYAYIIKNYRDDKTGGFRFSVNADGRECDNTYDLYAHAFMLLASAAYYRATKDEGALKYAADTLQFINKYFKHTGCPGFAEALDGSTLKPLPRTRRQNPHMHLLEGCLDMFEVSESEVYRVVSTEIIDLFYGKFFDLKTGTLGEFFDQNLLPCEKEGHLVEAGHHAEWVWLLKRYQSITGQERKRYLETMKSLFDFVQTQGIDKKYGGIFNSQNREGHPEDVNKRIWSVLEVLRASSIMMNVEGYEEGAQKLLCDMTLLLKEEYIWDDGWWTETLNRNLSPKSNKHPGTTPYHILPAIRDAAAFSRSL